MNTTAIKNFAQRARRDFRKLVTDKAHALGIGKKEIAKAVEKGDALVIHGQAFPVSIKRQREELIDIVQQQGFDHVVDAMAYTLFNRLCALRFMEVHDYLPQRVLSAKDGSDVPDILKNAADVADQLFSDPKARKAIKELKLAGTQDQELYKRLLLAQCNALAPSMPFLFEVQRDYSELLMPDNLLHSDSVIRDMVKGIDEEDWKEIEIIGWLYQFYISERKDEVIGSVVEKEDIPAATQLFTPKYIVRYMVENSLGRLWLESHPESPLKDKMPYFIENPDDKKTLPTKRFDTPDEIKCMDNACGSGHILVFKFDLLYEMYSECGYPKVEIPSLILKQNLYGLDIDERAVQLASFALMMKAREKDPKFLEKKILPQVLAIQESNGIDLNTLFNTGVANTANLSPFRDPTKLLDDESLLPVQKGVTESEKILRRLRLAFQPLVQLFRDAKNYGSLLVVPDTLKVQLPFLTSDIEKIEHSDQLFDRRIGGVLKLLIRQAERLATRHDVCCTNPPYMGSGAMNAALRSFGERVYPHAKADLFTMFIQRNGEFVEAHGFVAMITMQSWMFLTSYEDFRSDLLSRQSIVTMAHLGPRAFDQISGEIVQTTAFCFTSLLGPDAKGIFLRLVDGQNEAEKEEMLLEKKNRHIVSPHDFLAIPGHPIAYWLSDKVRSSFASAGTLNDVGPIREGINTGDNGRFLHWWFEVSNRTIDFHCLNPESQKAKWLPHKKGGGFRRWWGNMDFVLNWGNQGEEIHAFHGLPLTYNGAPMRGKTHFFKESISWSRVSSCTFAARYYPAGFTYDSTAPSIFPKSDIDMTLGFVNSAVVGHLLAALCPTLDFRITNVARLPLKDKQYLPSSEAIGPLVTKCKEIAKQDWDNFETSWDFKVHPLLGYGGKFQSLEEAWRELFNDWKNNISKLQGLETENNRLFIEAYGLQDELKPDVPEEQITLARADEERDIKSLLSYAVGCMMGRYSLSKPGLQFAGGEWDATQFKGAKFQPDPDGILPVLNDSYFEDDPTALLAEFLAVTFGKNTLNENLQFIAQTLGMKGNESPRDAIRRYLSEGFFKDHLRTYKKRPIYWLFSSGKEKAFQALVYMHRYTPATLSRMRTAYLHELQNKLNARLGEVQRSIDEATSTTLSNRLSKELIRIKRQQAELLAFDQKLNNIASQKIAIDLDDGVKHNYGLFGDLLAEVKTVCGKDEE